MSCLLLNKCAIILHQVKFIGGKMMKNNVYAAVDANVGTHNSTLSTDISSSVQLGDYVSQHSHNTSVSTNHFSESHTHDSGVLGVLASHHHEQNNITGSGFMSSESHLYDIGGYQFGTGGSTEISANGVKISNTFEIANHDYSCSVTCCPPMPNLGIMSFFNSLPAPQIPSVDLSFVGNAFGQCPAALTSLLSGLGTCLDVIKDVGSAGIECLGVVAEAL
ncbi:MAG: hypothetical protein EBQ95_05835 [Gammaproteobacteria bacterium]|nr:hypothetical protein [Gammaproteobacteria bacterium]